MRVVLRIIAVFWTAWAVVLLGFADTVVPSAWLTPAMRSAAAGAGVLHLGAAGVLWHAGRDVARRRGVVFAVIALLALRWAADTYGVLVALPPRAAMFALGDLIVTVALLVGVLESLPRMLSVSGSPGA